MKLIKSISISTFILLCIACGNNQSNDHSSHSMKKESNDPATTQTETSFKESKNGITVTIQPNSPQFPNAELTMNEPIGETVIPAGKTKFIFSVKNYELGKQTSDAGDNHCANSAQGQHIHLILNNEPYTAHYEPEFEVNLAKGHHVVLAFLSRSYHESIKSKAAYKLTQVDVGEETVDHIDLTSPHLFYSRPKGTYEGHDAHKILLDFYIVNTALSPNGNKVKATINGTTFILPYWQPYAIEGLPMGENKIALELIDKEGNLVPGVFNSVERKITLKE